MLPLLISIACLLTLFNPVTPSLAEEKTEEGPVAAVGSETCGMCHEDMYDLFLKSIHSKTDDETRFKEPLKGCEGCHGAGEAHIDGDGDVKKIFHFKNESPGRRSAVCLECHDNDPAKRGLKRGAHNLAGISCDACHSVHSKEETVSLLREEPPSLCYDCHAGIEALFRLPERHRVPEGAVSCGDCHNVHAPSPLSAFSSRRKKDCTRCHIDMEGPFVYEHEAVEVEGCLSCHEPHGSVNRHLLIFRDTRSLCLSCHTLIPGFHLQPRFSDCASCHIKIHGSNFDKNFLN